MAERASAAALASLVLLAIIAVPLVGAVPGAGAADPCAYRGRLDALYCDENRDGIADLPKDPAKIVSPETLIFTYAPVEEPAIYETAWGDFLKHLEKVTGKKAKYFGLQNYAAQIEAMRSGRLHISAYSTGSLVYAVHIAGAVPFAIMRDAKGPAGYHLIVIAPAKNDKISGIADLKGKRVAHVSQTSNSGHQAPVYFFSKLGVVPGKDYQIAFSGKHDNSALGVVNGDYDAAAVADTVVDRMVARGVIKASDFKVIYRSPVFPTAGFAYSHNLEPKLAERIRDAFTTFKLEGTSLGKEFKGRTGFMPVNYQKDWEAVVGILEANGASFTKESADYKKLQQRGGE